MGCALYEVDVNARLIEHLRNSLADLDQRDEARHGDALRYGIDQAVARIRAAAQEIDEATGAGVFLGGGNRGSSIAPGKKFPGAMRTAS